MASIPTLVRYNADGNITDFQFNLERNKDVSSIMVYINDSLQTEGVNYSLDEGTNQVKFNSAPPAGSVVRIERVTDEPRAVDFSNTSIIDDKVLDKDADQAFQIAQEAKNIANEALGLSDTEQVNFSALGKRIANLADPEEGSDAATKDYVDIYGINSGATFYKETITATSDGQTIMEFPVAYFPGKNVLWVYDQGGNLLRQDVDYTETDTFHITLISPLLTGEFIYAIWIRPTNVNVGIQFQSGALIDRPANVGYVMYYANDVGRLFYDNGTLWEEINVALSQEDDDRLRTKYIEYAYNGEVVDFIGKEWLVSENIEVLKILVYAKEPATLNTTIELYIAGQGSPVESMILPGFTNYAQFDISPVHDFTNGQRLSFNGIIGGIGLTDLVIRMYYKQTS